MSEPEPLPSQYFDPPDRVIVGTERRRVNAQEWTVLEALWRCRGRLVDHPSLMAALYPPPKTPTKHFDSLLKVTVCRLRAKLVGTPLHIENVFGQGYRLRVTAVPAQAPAAAA